MVKHPGMRTVKQTEMETVISDQDSVESCNDDENDELPHRVESKKLAYDPSCEIPLWEIGMVFESANQFRETIAKDAVLEGCN
ncbi:conserved hypothetical protein [Ricinus communis]|uniref:Uncharacterized protein n=1 Tax=Ricinus communis TaxID=3988 RepID=B9SFP8_RICCO|nr:conserved hypothetical protein [Ricinus communis]